MNKARKELFDVSVYYSLSGTIGPLAEGFPEEIVLPAIISALGSLDINPEGLEYSYTESVRTALISFYVPSEDLNKLYSLFPLLDNAGKTFDSLSVLSALSDLSSIFPGDTTIVFPPANYVIQPQLVLTFRKAISDNLALRVAEALNSFGTIQSYSLVGKQITVIYANSTDSFKEFLADAKAKICEQLEQEKVTPVPYQIPHYF